MAEGGYVIQDGIPLPPVSRAHGGGREAKYPFATMEIGQSFGVPYNGEDAKKVTRRIRTAILVFRRRAENADKYFRTRAGTDEVRCWRIEKNP
jgi:hypothetical protein